MRVRQTRGLGGDWLLLGRSEGFENVIGNRLVAYCDVIWVVVVIYPLPRSLVPCCVLTLRADPSPAAARGRGGKPPPPSPYASL